MSACTPYPATFPCDPPAVPPVHVNPYRPTPPPAETTGLLPLVPAAPDDELRVDRTTDVPEPSAVLLTVIALATLWRARRTAR